MREENRQIRNESERNFPKKLTRNGYPEGFRSVVVIATDGNQKSFSQRILYLGIRLLDLPQQLAKREHAARRGRQV